MGGNERLAGSATRTFCPLNGRELSYTVAEAEDLMHNPASDHPDEPTITAWLVAHLGAASFRRELGAFSQAGVTALM